MIYMTSEERTTLNWTAKPGHILTWCHLAYSLPIRDKSCRKRFYLQCSAATKQHCVGPAAQHYPQDQCQGREMTGEDDKKYSKGAAGGKT